MITPGVSPWDLWVLRALDPAAGPAQVTALRASRRRQAAWELAACERLLAGDLSCVRPGRRLLEQRPELASGLLLGLHLGPYQLLLEPFLAAGLRVVVLLNRAAERRLRPLAESVLAGLGHRGRIAWLVVEEASAGRRLLRALRGGGPVLAFADGNQGLDGLAGTRRRGVPYRLPGREIRVRTGLARLACRTGCPVHPLRVRWREDGRSVDWRAQPTQRWGRDDDPVAVTRLLFDWVFAEVAAAPRQWSYWDMLGEAAAGFAAPADRLAVPPGLQADYRRAFLSCLAGAADTVRVELQTRLAIWPGEVLADLGGDRFYTAEGLGGADLALLEDRPSLARLLALRGRDWVTYHGLRLCLLGLARLAGGADGHRRADAAAGPGVPGA